MRVKSLFTGLLGALAAALALAPAMAQTPADVLKPGTVFYLESENKLTGAKEQFTVRIDTVGVQVHGTRTDAGKSPRPIKDILREVQTPLSVGQTWEHKPPAFQREWRGIWANYQYDGKATVAGEETIVVAGQPVKTLRIVYSGKVNRVGIGGVGVRSWEYEQIRWYAPPIGYVVQYVANETENGEKLWDYASKVVKIQYTGNISAIGSGQGATLGYTQTRWYAPELGYVVKFIGTETDRHTYTAELTVTKIDLPAAANPAAAPAPATPVATAAAPAEQPKQ